MKTSLYMKTIFGKIAIVSLFLISLNACKKDTLTEQFASVQVLMTYPNINGQYSIKNMTAKLTETNSGTENTVAVTDLNGTILSAELPYGTYIVSLEGDVAITENGHSKDYKLKGYQANIIINSAMVSAPVSLFLSDPSAKFVFKEIFFTGTVTPENKSYNGDKYFILYNNSTDTLYADGLILAQSKFLTTTKYEYKPDVMNEAFTTDDIIMLPGSGKDYPVAPGKQLVIANNAINHKEIYSNSVDLSQADFEIELIGSINIDNPAVPNTISLSGSMLMHNRGFTSYVLVQLPEGKQPQQWLDDNQYTYSYLAANGREMKVDAYKIDNSYIMDAVNLSVEQGFAWIVTAPNLDMGWTYCGRNSSDATRYGKSVSRKTLSSTNGGILFLQDTNNSAEDFNPESVLSL